TFSPEQVSSLTTRLTDRIEGRRQRLFRALTLGITFFFIVAYADSIFGPHPQIINRAFNWLMTPYLGGLLRTAWLEHKEHKLKVADLFDRQRRIPVLFESLNSYNDKLRVSARRALIGLLPQLKVEDTALFNAGVRSNIERALFEEPPSLV